MVQSPSTGESGSPSDRDAKAEERDASRNTIKILDTAGDVILKTNGSRPEDEAYFRVSSSKLRQSSDYFEKLLGSSAFSEGARVNSQLRKLKDLHGDALPLPSSALPVVALSDIHQPASVIAQFLSILHGLNDGKAAAPSALVMASLAILADRFAAIEAVHGFMQQHGWISPVADSKEMRRNSTTAKKEIIWRQRLLVGILLGINEWVLRYSTILVIMGSEKWTALDEISYEDPEALWWSLPAGVEGKNEDTPRRKRI